MDTLSTALLRRCGRLHLPEPPSEPPADAGAWVRAVETDLAERGWLLDAAARARLAALDRSVRTRWADWLLAVADQSVGAHRVHTPLFRSFPAIPADLDKLFVERVLVHWFQDSDIRCVLCGEAGTIRPTDPCGHLVCHRCFDSAEYTACPICGRRTRGAGTIVAATARPAGPPLRVTLISLATDIDNDARTVRDELVGRQGSLGESERDDLRVLIEATAPLDLAWLPDVVPSRETAALVGAWALQRAVFPEDLARLGSQIAARWTTATDAARTLWAYSGGDPGLVLPQPEVPGPHEAWRPHDEPPARVERPRVRALPRPLRRTVLAHLDLLGAAGAAEDMGRHPTVWKRLAERLHPFERVAAHPEAAVAFAAVRSTRTPAESALGVAIIAAAERHRGRLSLVEHDDGRVSVRSRSFAAAVEGALQQGDLSGAVSLLSTRPGELWRRLDAVARTAGDDPAAQQAVLRAAEETAGAVAPGVLAATNAALRGRESTVAAAEGQATVAAAEVQATAVRQRRRRRFRRARDDDRQAAGLLVDTEGTIGGRPAAPAPGTPRRVFFPRGNITRSWTSPERRGPLPAAFVAELRASVDRELVRRAALLDPFDIAVVDAALLDVPAPTRTGASSTQLAGWTRGTRMALPDLGVLRLFLHWVELEKVRVDLDLSCAFYDAGWSHLGHCDYTSLRFHKSAAVHSGDFTSAPPPFGSTEYLDLTVADLVGAGVRYAVPVVFSFNDVPFELLPEAFAGFSVPTRRDAQFDAGRVVQRFDLRGDARVLVPFIVDTVERELLWTDVHVTGRGYGHAAAGQSSNLGRLGADLWDHFAGGRRATLLDVAAWHAVGRARQIFVADFGRGRATGIDRDPDGAATACAVRAAAADPASFRDPLPDTTGRVALVVTADADRVEAVPGRDPAAGSLVVAPVGRAAPPWPTVRPEEFLAGLVPTR